MATNTLFANFAAFLSSIRDDLSNITSPPSFLAPQSVTESSVCWAERPALFVAPTFETTPERRCLAVLKWIIASHRRQFYIGEDASVGIQKPLNSFLGEVFREQWTDEVATTRVVTEQVSYQPPVTACYISSDEHRVWGDGFSRIEMSFTGTLIVRQIGYAMLHLDEHDEHYLIQLPNFEIKGFLAGHLYPEIYGTYHIVSTSGIMASITYSGQGLLFGNKNGFEAKVFRRNDKAFKTLYTITGCWSDRFSIYDCCRKELIEEWSHLQHRPVATQPSRTLSQQDPWESSRAWHEVKTALTSGDLSRAVASKLLFERAQRALRATNPWYDSQWEPLFFTSSEEPHPLLKSLASTIKGWQLDVSKTGGLWRYDADKARTVTKPYHGGKSPDRFLNAAKEEHPDLHGVYDAEEGVFRPLNTICESKLPQQQRDYLRQRRSRRAEIYG